MTLAGIVWWIKALALVSFGVPAAVVVGLVCSLLVVVLSIAVAALVGFLGLSVIGWVGDRFFGV